MMLSDELTITSTNSGGGDVLAKALNAYHRDREKTDSSASRSYYGAAAGGGGGVDPSDVAFEPVPGYENVKQEEGTVEPPPDLDPPTLEPWAGDNQTYGDAPTFTRDQVFEALQKEVKRHAMWKNKALKKMELGEIVPFTALHYVLETFTETRSTAYVNESSSTSNSAFQTFGCLTPDGRIPGPWEVDCRPSDLFNDQKKHIEVPGTSHVVSCSSCGGQGSSHCFFCHGQGFERCQTCNGTGMRAGVPHPTQAFWQGGHPGTIAGNRNRQTTYGSGMWAGVNGNRSYIGGPHPPFHRQGSGGFGTIPGSFGTFGSNMPSAMGGNVGFGHGGGPHGVGGSMFNYRIPPPGVPPSELCFFCKGSGGKPCSHCVGSGRKPCHLCSGCGKIKTFVRLTVRYKTEWDDFVIDQSDVPERLMKEVNGEVIFAEEKNLVQPLLNYHVKEVNENSRRVIGEHRSRCLTRCRILRQRQTLRAIPIVAVAYNYKGENRQFWVYGQEKKVFISNYPKKCCIL